MRHGIALSLLLSAAVVEVISRETCTVDILRKFASCYAQATYTAGGSSGQ